MRRSRTLLILVLLLPFVSACGTLTTRLSVDLKPVAGPPIREVESPFAQALACVKGKLTPEQRKTSFSVGAFPDQTGRVAYSSENAFGAWSTQGGADALMTALAGTGVTVVETGLAYRQVIDWYLGKGATGLLGDGNVRILHDPATGTDTQTKTIPSVKGTVRPASYLLIGSITSLDFLPGGAVQLYMGGVGGGHRQYRILVGMNARVVRMTVGEQLGGEVVAAQRISKEIVADESQASVARFFGGRDSATLVEFNLGNQRVEALQYIQNVMLEYVAASMVAETFGITGCETHLRAVALTPSD